MAPPRLELVRKAHTATVGEPQRPRASRRDVGVFLLLAVTVALGASLTRIDLVRNEVEFSELAQETIRLAQERGASSLEVRSNLAALQEPILLRPLDAKGRSLYAVATLGVSQALFRDAAAATFHAELAARSAPVTVSVLSRSARVLALSNRRERAFEINHSMYEFDPDKAAKLTMQIAPFESVDRLEEILPDLPEGYVALYRALAEQRRTADAGLLLERAWERWPHDLVVLRQQAARVLRADGVAGLSRLFRPEFDIDPTHRDAPTVLAYRARWRASVAERQGALNDIDLALETSRGSRWISYLAGEAYLELGELEQARRQWNRTLFETPASDTSMRVRLLVRLARLEAQAGSDARTLDLWREVLALSPKHQEAQRELDRWLGKGLTP